MQGFTNTLVPFMAARTFANPTAIGVTSCCGGVRFKSSISPAALAYLKSKGIAEDNFDDVTVRNKHPKEAIRGRIKKRVIKKSSSERFSSSHVGVSSIDDVLNLLSTPVVKPKSDTPEVLEEDGDEDIFLRKRLIPNQQSLASLNGDDDDEAELIGCERLRLQLGVLPRKLQKAVQRVLSVRPVRQYVNDGLKLSSYLYLRAVPWTELLPDKDIQMFRPTPLEKKRARLVQDGKKVDAPWFSPGILRPRSHHGHSNIRYSNREAYAYMASRMEGHYVAVYRVLREISVRLPDFEPQHMLDFGAGLATASWAAHELWGGSLKEYVCVDQSKHMTDMADLLLRQGDANAAPSFGNVFFRNFMPPSPLVKYDLVIAGHSLSELPCEKQRRQVIEMLWEKTNDFLIIVEHGFWPGFNIIREARRVVLGEKAYVKGTGVYNYGNETEERARKAAEDDMYPELEDDEKPQKAVGHVFGPCPHDKACPKERMIVRGTCHKPCYFSNNTNLSTAERNTVKFSGRHHKERLSYVVFRKGERPRRDEVKQDRLLMPMQRRGRHAIGLVCQGTGELSTQIYTRTVCNDWYSAIRQARWGDLLPHLDISRGRNILSLQPKRLKHKHYPSADTAEPDTDDFDMEEEEYDTRSTDSESGKIQYQQLANVGESAIDMTEKDFDDGLLDPTEPGTHH